MTRTIISFIILLAYPLCLIIMIRLHTMDKHFHTSIMMNWREAIENQDLEATLLHRSRAYEYTTNFPKLLVQFWRKLP